MNDQSPDSKTGVDPADKVGDQTGGLAAKIGRRYDKMLLFSYMYGAGKGKYMNELFGPKCRVCGKIEFDHGIFPSDPNYHPFCKDNLDFLEWKHVSNHK